MIATRWRDGTRMNVRELRLSFSLWFAGCPCRLPLFGAWADGDINGDHVWRVRCRLCNTHGRRKTGGMKNA